MSSRPKPKPNVLNPIDSRATVAGEDQEIGPGDLPAVLLLDRPEQPARLVEARVVGPAVEGGEALSAAAATAPAVGDAVRAGGVPRHPDEERPVVAVVGRPPVLRRRHHLDDVLLQRVEVEGLELLCVVEVLAHRIGHGRVLVEDLQVQLIRPPVLVRPGPGRLGSRGGDYWVLAFAAAVRHVGPSPLSLFPSDGWLLSTLIALDPRLCRSAGVARASFQPSDATDVAATHSGHRPQ